MRNPETDCTNHPELDDRLREPLDEEERLLMDPDTWDWDNIIEGVPTPNASMVFQVRLSRDELAQIEPAAIADGVNVIAYMRNAALRSARMRSRK